MKKLFLLCLYITLFVSITCSSSALISMGSRELNFLCSLGGRRFSPRDFPFITRANSRSHHTQLTHHERDFEDSDSADKEDTGSDTSTSSSRSSSENELDTLATEQEGIAAHSSFWQDLKLAWAIALAFAGGHESELFEEEELEAQQDSQPESSASNS